MAPISAIVRALAFVAVVLLGAPAAVAAHANLVSSEPADGATVQAGFAGPIVLTFSEALQAGSHAELLDASGTKAGDAAIDPANKARMVFSISAPLASATYTVQWTSVAADRDIARGTFVFTVAVATPPPPSPTPTPTAAASATVAPTSTPSPSPLPTITPSGSPSPGTTGSAADIAIPIVAGLAIVLAVGVYLLRRGRTPPG